MEESSDFEGWNFSESKLLVLNESNMNNVLSASFPVERAAVKKTE